MNDLGKVSIIVTTYLEQTKPYLDVCIESINNLVYPKDKIEVILVARKGYAPEYPNVKTVYPEEEEFHNAHGVRFGMQQASKDSKYLFYINDDVMLTKNSLIKITNCVGDNMVIVNSISPCDNYMFYNLLFGFRDKDNNFCLLRDRFYKLENLQGHLKELMDADSLYPAGTVPVPYLCMYATLIPRKVYDLVGEWDDNFKTGQDDIDYALRAKQSGCGLFIALDSLVWHFGGRTADTTMNDQNRRDSAKYFVKKWGQLPPCVTQEFLDG